MNLSLITPKAHRIQAWFCTPEPCLFCGGRTFMHVSRSLIYSVVCNECGASGPERSDMHQALNEWNKKAA